MHRTSQAHSTEATNERTSNRHLWNRTERIAEAVGVSRQSINSIERERYVPSLELALTFARVFGRSTDEIFSLEKKK